MWKKIKNTFFRREFIIFCIIGLVAYLVHQGIYLLYTRGLNMWDDKYRLTSTAVAFSIASVVSYVLNAKLTYNKKMTKERTFKAILTYIAKFALTMSITLGIMSLANNYLDNEGIWYKIIDICLPIILTAITLILQFLLFNIIFKHPDNIESDEAK